MATAVRIQAAAGQNIGRRAPTSHRRHHPAPGDALNPGRIEQVARSDPVPRLRRAQRRHPSTGNEVVEPALPWSGQIFDVTRFTLTAIKAQAGAWPMRGGRG
jgi:molybdopterin biosynthesis enzyme